MHRLSAAPDAPRVRAAPALAVALALALLSGCATRAPSVGGDGPPPAVPPGLERVPDAVPRVEPLRVGGPNKPYEIDGRRYVPVADDRPLRERGGASWYGRKFHGRPTSSGEPYDMFAMTAAHRTMPIPSYARVRNPANGREVIVRVNDRGPFADGRVIDLSYTAALRLGLLAGVAPVEVERLTHDEIRSGRWRRGDAPADEVAAVLPAARAEAVPVGAAPLPAAAAGGPGAALPPDDPAPGDTASPGFWLQLGAFRARDGALTLQRQLLAADAALPGVALRAEDGVFRVQAGPWPTREAAQAAAAALRDRLGLAGMVMQRR